VADAKPVPRYGYQPGFFFPFLSGASPSRHPFSTILLGVRMALPLTDGMSGSPFLLADSLLHPFISLDAFGRFPLFCEIFFLTIGMRRLLVLVPMKPYIPSFAFALPLLCVSGPAPSARVWFIFYISDFAEGRVSMFYATAGW